MVTSIHTFHNRSLGENGKDPCTRFSKEVIPFLRSKLGSCAHKLLMHKCDRDDVGGSLKTKVSFHYCNLTKSEVPRIDSNSTYHCRGKWSKRYSAFIWVTASQLLIHWMILPAPFCLRCTDSLSWFYRVCNDIYIWEVLIINVKMVLDAISSIFHINENFKTNNFLFGNNSVTLYATLRTHLNKFMMF